MSDPRRYIATIEARMSSSRLPGKVLADVGGKPALALQIERVKRAKSLDGIIVATTSNEVDEPIADLAAALGVGCFRGSEEDVLARVLGAARMASADVIVELTGDCILVDPHLIDECIAAYRDTGADYVYNVILQPPHSYPIGMDVQVFSTDSLAESDLATQDPDDREHVSLYIRERPERFRPHYVQAPPELREAEIAIVLDTADDLELIRAVYAALAPINEDFGVREILEFLRTHPEIAALNSKVFRRLIHVNDEEWK